MDATEFASLHIFGSGALSYPWWVDIERTVEGWLITSEDPDSDGGTVISEVTAGDLIDAARTLLHEMRYTAVGDDGSYTRLGLLNFVALNDDTDIDADVADLILQTAVLGEVVYA